METLKRALLANGPAILKTSTLDSTPQSRLQGPGKGPPNDVHNTGRALDIVIYAKQPPQFMTPFYAESAIGYGLVNTFLDQRPGMKWNLMIYDQKEWNSSGTVSERKLVPFDPGMKRVNHEHLTHIHIQWSNADADNTGFYDDLVAAFADAGYP